MALVTCANAPLVFSSTRLIKGIVNTQEDPKPNPFPRPRLELMLRKVLSRCSSDAYIFINQPGLTYEDFKVNDQKIFFNVQKKLSEDSTVISFPYVENGVSFEKLTKYVLGSCDDVDVIRINVDEEEMETGDHLPRYIDTKARVIIVNLPRLPVIGDADYRRSRIEAHDKYIRRVLQRLPSPYLSIVLTSNETSINDVNFYSGHPKNAGVPLEQFRRLSSNYNPMSWITNDPRRINEEYIFKEVDYEETKAQDLLPRKNKYEEWILLSRKEEEDLRLLSGDLFYENEAAIVAFILVVVSFLAYTAVIGVMTLYSELKRLARQWIQVKRAKKEKKDK